ncbi:MAG: LrgB family protein, partial [Oxalobacter sp.]|nr:LrgB family protein [Oxalobacter sp.]
MSDFLHSELFAVTMTVGLFWGAQLLQKRLKSIILNPILVAISLIILILKVGDISYETYYAGGKYIEFLLKPAIVALGVPLYQQIEQIRKQAVPIMACQLVGCIVGAVSAFLISHYLGASMDVGISLAPKSATTPIAMEVSSLTGGIPSLTAIIVIITGILGAIFGLKFLRLVGVKTPIAQGLALGAAAHAVGTSHAMD